MRTGFRARGLRPHSLALLRLPIKLSEFVKSRILKAGARFARSRRWFFSSTPEEPLSEEEQAISGEPLSEEESEFLLRLERARQEHDRWLVLQRVLEGEVPVPDGMVLTVGDRTYPPGSWYRRSLRLIQGGQR